MAMATGLMFSLFDVASSRKVPFGIPQCIYNGFFMDLPVPSFLSHSSLLTAKSVDLAVTHDGFPSKWKSSVILIVVTLIAEVLFEQLLIRNAVYQVCMGSPVIIIIYKKKLTNKYTKKWKFS